MVIKHQDHYLLHLYSPNSSLAAAFFFLFSLSVFLFLFTTDPYQINNTSLITFHIMFWYIYLYSNQVFLQLLWRCSQPCATADMISRYVGPCKIPFPKVLLTSCNVCLFLAYLLPSHQWNATIPFWHLLDSHKSISTHPGVPLVQQLIMHIQVGRSRPRQPSPCSPRKVGIAWMTKIISRREYLFNKHTLNIKMSFRKIA